MIWPGLYLLIWLLILGSAIVYAADDYVELRVCARVHDHILQGFPLFVRRSSIMMFADDGGKVKHDVCTTILLTNGRKIFVEGSIDEMHEKLDEVRNQ